MRANYVPMDINNKYSLTSLPKNPELKDESVPNTPRGAPHEPELPPAAATPAGDGDQSNMSVEMDMSMDDL